MYINAIEGLTEDAIDFFFCDNPETCPNQLSELIDGFNQSPCKDDLVEISKLPTLYARASMLRQWRYAMLQYGKTIQEIAKVEGEFNWPVLGHGPLPVVSVDNPYSIPEFILRGDYSHEELLNYLIIFEVDLTAAASQNNPFKEYDQEFYAQWDFSIFDISQDQYSAKIQSTSHIDAQAILMAYMHELKRSYAYEPLTSMIGVEKVIAIIEDIEAAANNSRGEGPAMNFALSGEPGKGKTQLAKAIHTTLFRLGIINRDRFIACSHDELNTRGLVDKDSQETAKAFMKAVTGTLFLDEVHHLVYDQSNGQGGPASIINVNAEKYRGKMAVIVATYPDKMPIFLQADPGLTSRFLLVSMDDYSASQTVRIFEKLAGERGYIVDGDAMRSALWNHFHTQQKEFGMSVFDSGRAARTLLDKVIAKVKSDENQPRQGEFNGLVSMAPVLTVAHYTLARQSRERIQQAKRHEPAKEQNPFANDAEKKPEKSNVLKMK